jgi:hypothetical protein
MRLNMGSRTGSFPFQLLNPRDMLKIADHETRAVKVMFGSAPNDEGTVGNHSKVGMRNRVGLPIVHANTNRLESRFPDQGAKFGWLHKLTLRKFSILSKRFAGTPLPGRGAGQNSSGLCGKREAQPSLRMVREGIPTNCVKSQRDCVTQPRVATKELPWVPGQKTLHNAEGVAASRERIGRNPFGVDVLFYRLSQGSSFVATLGWRLESLWDSFCERQLLKAKFTLIFGSLVAGTIR